MGDFDMSEVSRFADELAGSPSRTTAKVRGSLTRHINTMARDARAAAPRDRPWLATHGIEVAVDADRLTRELRSGLDPRGNPVALFVEYGTVKQPPRPFMLPQLDKTGPLFVADVERILGEQF